MIINTYPINSSQPAPDFVGNFYNNLRGVIIDSNGVFEESEDAVKYLLKLHQLSASISLQSVSFDDWEKPNVAHYIIFGWRDESEQYEFIKFYSKKKMPKPTQQQHVSYQLLH